MRLPILILVLFFGTNSYAQTEPSVFCTFSPPNIGADQYLMPCASELVATIEFSDLPGNDTVEFIFPNSFSITNLDDLGTGIIPEIASVSGEYYKIYFPIGVSGSVNITMDFVYCNVYGDEPTNTSNLVFDCSVLNPTGVIFAKFSDPMSVIGVPNGTVQYSFSAAIPVTIIPPTVFTGIGGTLYDRKFDVKLVPSAINNFQMKIVQESDVENLGMWIKNGSDSLFLVPDSSNSTTFFYSIDLSNSLISSLVHLDVYGNRILTFNQNCKLICDASSNATGIFVILECLNCDSDRIFNATMNGYAGQQPQFVTQSALTRRDSSVAGCSGEYILTLDIKDLISPSLIKDFFIPYNGSYFDIDSIFIAGNSIPLDSCIFSVDSVVSNSIIKIPLWKIFDSIPSWSGLIDNLVTDSIIYGPWLMPDSTVQVQLVMKYDCSPLQVCNPPYYSLAAKTDSGSINPYKLSRYTSCGNFDTINLVTSPIVGRSNSNSTLNGGCNDADLDLGGPSNVISFSYHFFRDTNHPLTLFRNNIATSLSCADSIQYRAVFTASSPSNVDFSVSTVNSDGNWAPPKVDGSSDIDYHELNDTLYIPFIQNFGDFTSDINFCISIDSCAFPLPPFSGGIVFNMEIQAICTTCEDLCIRTLACVADPYFVLHCAGDCDGYVIVSTEEVSMERTTFGWANSNLYPDSPILSKSYFLDTLGLNEDIVDVELHKAYPFDLIEVNSQGVVSPMNLGAFPYFSFDTLGFEIAYSTNLGMDVLEFIEGGINCVNEADTSKHFELSVGVLKPIFLGTAFGIPDSMYIMQLSIAEPPLQLDSSNYDISFKGKIRVRTLDSLNVGAYMLNFRCQFINTNNSGGFLSSCDPWGEKLLILVPGVEKDSLNHSIPNPTITTAHLGNETHPPTAVFDSLSFCRANYVIGFHLTGGMGEQVDDFPLEFRPFIRWPFSGTIAPLYAIDSLYGGNIELMIDSVGHFTRTDTTKRILNSIEKRSNLHYYQGLEFTFLKDCPNSEDTIPINLDIIRYAYIHPGHELDSTAFNQSIGLGPVPLAIQQGTSGNFPCENMVSFLTATNAGVADTFNYKLALRSLAMIDSTTIDSTGPPSWFYYKLIPSNPLDSFALASPILELPLDTVGNPNLYFFENGFLNDTLTIPVSLNCNSATYQLKFYWGAFCDTSDFNRYALADSIPESCLQCARTIPLIRNAPLLLSSNQVNSFAVDSCELEWTIRLTNPANRPTLFNSQLLLNAPIGLLYNSGTITYYPVTTVLDSSGIDSVSSALSIPGYALVPMVAPFNGNPVLALTFDGVDEFATGAMVEYKLRFGFEQFLCGQGSAISQNSIRALFKGEGPCFNDTLDNPNLLAIPATLPASSVTITENPNCCVQSGITISSSGPCIANDSTGMLVVTIAPEDTVSHIIYILSNNAGVTSIDTIAATTHDTLIALNVGIYGVIVQNTISGVSIEQTITITDRTINPQLTLSTPVICNGDSINLSATVSNSDAGPFNYQWISPAALAAESLATIVHFPTDSTVYTLAVSNQYGCSDTVSTHVAVYETPNAVITVSGSTSFCAGDSVTLTASGGSTYAWGGLGIGPHLTVSQSGIYTVSAHNSSSCSDTASISITVHSLPVALIFASDSTAICNGDSITLTASGGSTFSWNGGLNTASQVIADTAGAYSVLVSDTNGCSDSTQVNITVKPLPQPLLTVSDTVCLGQSYFASFTPNGGVLNMNGEEVLYTDSSFSFTATETGIDTILYAITENGCTGVDFKKIHVFSADASVSILMDSVLCLNDSYPMSFSPEGGSLWVDDVLYTDSLLSAPDLGYGAHNLVYETTNSYGCSASDSLIINVSGVNCTCGCPDSTAIQVQIPDSIITGSQLIVFFGTDSIIDKCIRLNHDLEIENYMYFNNCNFVMGAGVKLTIDTATSVIIYNSQFVGCDTLWRGISNFGNLNLNNTLIRDAQYGLVVERFLEPGNEGTNLTQVTFSNNFIGLTNSDSLGYHKLGLSSCTFDGGALLKDYIGQTPATNPLGGLAGIRVFNRFHLYLYSTTIFKNLYNGIIVDHARLDVSGTKFKNIQFTQGNYLYEGNSYFLGSSGDPSAAINILNGSWVDVIGSGTSDNDSIMFHGCKTGVVSDQSTVTVQNCRFAGYHTAPSYKAISVKNSMLGNCYNIRNNRIHTNVVGISVRQSAPDGMDCANIVNNNISLVDNSEGIQTGLRIGINIGNMGDAYGLLVDSNTVNILSGDGGVGITMNMSGAATVIRNDIVRHTASIGENISVSASDYIGLACNRSVGISEEVYEGENSGFVIVNSIGARVFFNSTNNTRNGFVFEEDNTDANFLRNEMGDHGDDTYSGRGLKIGNNGIVGIQENKWNRWLGSTTLGAEDQYLDTLGGLSPNSFYVQADDIYPFSEFYPFHEPFNSECTIDNFFTCIPEEDEAPDSPCESYGSSVQARMEGSEEDEESNAREIARALAKGEIQFTEYNKESNYSLRRSIGTLINDEKLHLPDTGIFVSLKMSLDSAHIKGFIEVDKLMRKAPINGDDKLVLRNYQDELRALYTQLIVMDSSLIADTANIDQLLLNNYQSLQQQIESKNFQIAAINQTAAQARTINREAAFSYNQGIVTQNDFDVYEKQINAIYLSTIAAGNNVFNAGQKATIETIAGLCPLLGGRAVYKARSLFSTYNDTMFFNNKTLCKEHGLQYRLAKNKDSTKYESIKVYPNPTKGILNVELKTEITNPTLMNIYSTLGQLVYSTTVTGKTIEVNLNATSISKGMYILEIRQNEEKPTIRSRFVYEP